VTVIANNPPRYNDTNFSYNNLTINVNSSQTQIQIPPFHDPEGYPVEIKVFVNDGLLDPNHRLF